MKGSAVLLALIGIAIAPSSSLSAGELVDALKTPPVPVPAHRFFLSSLTVIRYNPLGLETDNSLIYRTRLVVSDSPLFRETFFGWGMSLKLNPAYLKVGPLIEFQPVAALNFRCGYEYVGYFGTVGNLLSYAVPDADFSDDAREDMKSRAYSTHGHHYFLAPTLQIKYGQVAARSLFSFEYWDLRLHRGDTYFYEPQLDTLVPVKRLVWTNDTDLLYLGGRWTIGLRYSAVFPGTNQRHMRLGPLLAWSFNDKEYTHFNKPMLVAIIGWYLTHPNRMGPAPFFLVGLSFSCDFLAPAK